MISRRRLLTSIPRSRHDAEACQDIDITAQSHTNWSKWRNSLNGLDQFYLRVFRAGAIRTPTRLTTRTTALGAHTATTRWLPHATSSLSVRALKPVANNCSENTTSHQTGSAANRGLLQRAAGSLRALAPPQHVAPPSKWSPANLEWPLSNTMPQPPDLQNPRILRCLSPPTTHGLPFPTSGYPPSPTALAGAYYPVQRLLN